MRIVRLLLLLLLLACALRWQSPAQQLHSSTGGMFDNAEKLLNDIELQNEMQRKLLESLQKDYEILLTEKKAQSLNYEKQLEQSEFKLKKWKVGCLTVGITVPVIATATILIVWGITR